MQKGREMEERGGEAGGASAVPQAPEMSVTGWVVRLILWMSLGFIIGVLISGFLGRHGHSRETAYRAVCGAHLHGIGQAVALYNAENDDSFPPDFYALVQSGQPADLFLCPGTGTLEPETNERAEFETHCDRVYVAGLDGDSPGALIMLYELPVNHSQEYFNYLRRDYSTTNAGGHWIHEMVQKSNDYLSEKRRGQR